MINNKSPFAASSWSHTYLLDNEVQIPALARDFSLLQNHSDWLWSQSRLLFNGQCGVLTWA